MLFVRKYTCTCTHTHAHLCKYLGNNLEDRTHTRLPCVMVTAD